MSDGNLTVFMFDCGGGVLSLRKQSRKISERTNRRAAEMRILSGALAGDPRYYPLRDIDGTCDGVAGGSSMGRDDDNDEG